jgi:hypothetical protein
MKSLDTRIWIGGGLVVLGSLMLAERIGVFRGLTDIFLGLVFVVGAIFFLVRLARNPQADWWAAIPGMALAGLAAELLVPRVVGGWGGAFFLGGLGLAFFVIYLASRQRWWALIPGGVLITLACLSVLEHTQKLSDAGGLLFLGLGATFLLVAVAASKRWAYIPGLVLMALGALDGIAGLPVGPYLWPAVLVVCGLLLIWRFARSR